jgi:hypothetical protein
MSWRVFLLSLGVATLLIAALWMSISPTYLTSDDVAIRSSIDGTFVPGEPPTGFTLMTHAALGWALVSAQALWPGLHGWDTVLVVTLVVAIAMVEAIAWTTRGALAVLVLSIAVVPLLVGMQFTISATLAGGAAVLVGSAERRRSTLILAVVVLAVGLLIRPYAAAAGAFLVVVLILAVRPSEWRRTAAILGVTTAALVVALLTDAAIYKRDPEWAAARQYNILAAQMFEWTRTMPTEAVDAAYRAAGWSNTDRSTIASGWGWDPEVFGLRRLAAVHALSSESAGLVGRVTPALRHLADVDLGSLPDRFPVPWETALAVLMVVALGSPLRTSLLRWGAVGVTFVVYGLVVEAFFKDLPFRLFGPLLALAIAVGVGAPGDRLHPWISTGAIIVSLALLVVVSRNTIFTLRADAADAQQTDIETTGLAAWNPSVIVAHADSFPSEYWWRPFHRPAIALPIIGISHRPEMHRYLRTAGRERFLQSLCTHPRTLIITEPDRLEIVSAYLSEHYGWVVEWERVITTTEDDPRFDVYSCALRSSH